MRKKTKPRGTAPAGVCGGRQARRPSDGNVEEHSGRERGLVHLAHAGEEVVSDFHDGCHCRAKAMSLQEVVALPVLAGYAGVAPWDALSAAPSVELTVVSWRS